MSGNRLFDKLENLPRSREGANAVLEKQFFDDLSQTNKISMTALEALCPASRKTILKHIRQGYLKGNKERVNGREMWLFGPEDVAKYLENVADLIDKAVHEKENRPRRVVPKDGYLSIMDAATECAVSHWTLRKHIKAAGVEVHVGAHGTKQIKETDLRLLQRYFEGYGRPKRIKKSAKKPAGRRIESGPYFDTFNVLWPVMRIQPDIAVSEITNSTGAAENTVRAWLRGEKQPSAVFYGGLVALFKKRFRCRLSPELEQMVKQFRQSV